MKVTKLQQRDKSFYSSTVADCASVAAIMLQHSDSKDSNVLYGIYFGFNCGLTEIVFGMSPR